MRWRIDTSDVEPEENSNEFLKTDHNFHETDECEEYDGYEDITPSTLTSGTHSRTHGSMNGNYLNDIEMMFGGSF